MSDRHKKILENLSTAYDRGLQVESGAYFLRKRVLTLLPDGGPAIPGVCVPAADNPTGQSETEGGVAALKNMDKMKDHLSAMYILRERPQASSLEACSLRHTKCPRAQVTQALARAQSVRFRLLAYLQSELLRLETQAWENLLRR